jgi:hypothetical protein
LGPRARSVISRINQVPKLAQDAFSFFSPRFGEGDEKERQEDLASVMNAKNDEKQPRSRSNRSSPISARARESL